MKTDLILPIIDLFHQDTNLCDSKLRTGKIPGEFDPQDQKHKRESVLTSTAFASKNFLKITMHDRYRGLYISA